MMIRLSFNKKGKNKKIFFYFFLFFTLSFIVYFYYPSLLTYKDNLSIFLTDIKKLKQENLELKQKNLLSKEVQYLNFLELKINELKKELNFEKEFKITKEYFNLTPDSIWNDIYYFPSSKDYFDYYVFANENVLIGKIVGRIGKWNKIKLFSSKDFSEEVILLKNNKPFYLLKSEGWGGGIIKVEVPRNFIFNSKKDLIYLVSPYNHFFLIGVFVKEEFDERDPLKTLYFKLPVNPYLINKAGVVKFDKYDELKEVSDFK